MKSFILLICIVTILAVSGCIDEMPFRYHANEDQRVSAQAGRDLANAAARYGLPPGSAAANQLANSADVSTRYIGTPDNPMDVSPLVKPIAGTWQNKTKQIDALKLREKLFAEGSLILTEKLGDITEWMNKSEGTKIDTTQFTDKVQALGDVNEIINRIAAGITVPEDSVLTAEEQKRIEALDSALNKINQQAGIAAGKRPTKGEVANSVLDKVTEAVTENPEISGLVAGVPGISIILSLLNRRKSKKVEKEKKQEVDTANEKVAQANHDAETAKREAMFQRDAVIEAKAQASAMAQIANKTTEELAKAMPAPAKPE